MHAGARRYQAFDPGTVILLGEFRLEAVFAAHTVPAVGVLVRHRGRTLYFTGDTLYDPQLEALAKQKIDLLFICINGRLGNMNAEEAAHKIPGGLPAREDLLDPAGPERLFAATGPVDILVLNASVQYRTRWDEIPSTELARQLQLNFSSTLRLLQLYVPPMRQKGWGRVLCAGSVQQYKPHPEMAVYAATKAAQQNLVLNLAKQLAPFGITVNNLAPGVIDTPRNRQALADPAYAPRLLAGIPAGFAGEARDCAAGALLLCSEEGRYITGTDLLIDGGMHL